MKQEPSIFDEVDDAFEAAADARAEADIAAGRTVSHESVQRWLRSWGSDKLMPRPTGTARNVLIEPGALP